MGASAESKLEMADRLHKKAVSIRKSDPDSADGLEAVARKKRKSAIRQLRGRPGKSKQSGRRVL